MATDYHHGARVTETTDSALSLQTVSTAVIGMVATAEDADASTFPLNTPVLLTRPQDGIGKAGTKGTLARSLQHIADQVRAPTVVVRVEEGADAAATASNVIGGTGDNGRYTGVKALLSAQQRLGVRPRILGIPGLETQSTTNALVTVAQQLRGFVYASCADSATIADALAYRNNFGARELMLIWPDFTNWDTDANAEQTALTAAVAMGLRAQIDENIGWHQVISNQLVNNVDGISADVYFDYLTAGTDADILNGAGITTLINRNGYRFWGSRTCDNAQFTFESYTRTAQVVADTIGDGVFAYSDKATSPSLIRDIIESINAKLRQYKNAGYILGGKCWFDPSLNDTASMKVGKFTISYEYTPVPPLEDLELQQTFTDTYFADLSSAITTANAA